MAPEMDQFYRSTMAIYKVSAPRPGSHGPGRKAGPAWRTGSAWPPCVLTGGVGRAGLSCGPGAGGVSGGSQSPQLQPEVPGQGLSSHPVSAGPAEPLSAVASASRMLGEAGQGPAAAGSRAPASGESLGLSVSLVANFLSQTCCCTAEGVLQVPDG